MTIKLSARNAITTRTENNKIRLPKKVVDWEIEGIVKLGIEARTQVRFGQDFSIQTLEDDGFEAVFLGSGAWTTPHLGVAGQDGNGVVGTAV